MPPASRSRVFAAREFRSVEVVVSRIRILIADDHAILRAGVRTLLKSEPDLEVVGETSNLCTVCEQTHLLQPDVVILNWSISTGSSLQTLQHLRQESPHTRVLVLAARDDVLDCRTALAAGATGYLVKSAAESDLAFAIRAVANGRAFVNVSLSGNQTDVLLNSNPHARTVGQIALSEREAQVLALLAQGHTNQEVARRLHIGEKTVATYRARLMAKLGLQSRADLVRYAVEMGHFTNNDSPSVFD